MAADPYDVSDPILYETQTHEPRFAHLRTEDPIHFCRCESRGDHWSVTRYRDIVAVERDPEIFSNAYERGGIRLQDQAIGTIIESSATFISMDPPEHTHYRNMVRPAFTSQNLRELQSELGQLVIGDTVGLGLIGG